MTPNNNCIVYLKQAYDNQNGYDVPFLRTVLEDNVHTQDLTSASEVSSLSSIILLFVQVYCLY